MKDKTVILHVQEVQHVKDVPSTIEFLDLPREIRDYIYIMIFLRNEPMYPSKDRAGVSEYAGLLRTNHQIYSEVIEILYSRNVFQIRGNPAWKASELLNLISGQRRDIYAIGPIRPLETVSVCRARFHLKKLYIPSHNISLDKLKHVISILKFFPNLEYLRIIYLASYSVKDMEVVSNCRLLRDRRPLLKNFTLCKRISYKEAEDITWMIQEKPYRNWTSVPAVDGKKHIWKNQDGVFREAMVVSAPQRIPE